MTLGSTLFRQATVLFIVYKSLKKAKENPQSSKIYPQLNKDSQNVTFTINRLHGPHHQILS